MPKKIQRKTAASKTAKKPVVKKMTKTAARAKSAPKATKVAPKAAAPEQHRLSRMSLFIYWIIILFFVSATFYILGRSQEMLKHPLPAVSTVEIIDGQNLADMTVDQRNDVASKYLLSGKAKFQNADYDSAARDLSVAIDAAPGLVDAYNLRGEAYMQIGDYTRAEADMTRAIELDADNSIAFYDRAILNMRLERYDAARIDFNAAMAAIERAPNEYVSAHDIFAKRAQLNLWAKDFSAAVSDYSLAISQKTDDYEDYAGRAEAYTAQAAYELAADDYLSAVKLIAEKIQIEEFAEVRDQMSRAAMSYFEKLAAIHVKMGALEQAKVDLQSSRSIAEALQDTEQVSRLDVLLAELG